MQKSKTQYSDQIVTMLGDLSNSLKTPLTQPYDPSKDTAYQAAQKTIGQDVYRSMARRGIADSTIAPQQQYELSMQALPQFQEAYYGRQQQDIGNKMAALGQLQSLDASDFQKAQALEQLQLQRGQMTGDYLTPEQQQQIENIDPSLNKFVDDYQAEINRRAAINPNDPSIIQLQYLRNQKIKDLGLTYPQSIIGQQTMQQEQADLARQQMIAQMTGQYISPEQQRIVQNGVTSQDQKRIDQVASQFGGYSGYLQQLDPNSAEYTKVQMLMGQSPGQKTMLGQQFQLEQAMAQEDLQSKRTQNQYLADQLQASLNAQQLSNIGQNISNQMNQINLKYLPQEKQLAIQAARQSLEAGKLDMAYKQIVNANLPAQIEAELNQAFAQTESIYANIGGQGGYKYSASDVSNKVSDYQRSYGTYDKIDKKWTLDKNRDGKIDNSKTILDQMKAEYSQNPSDGYYNMLKETAVKLGIPTSEFVRSISSNNPRANIVQNAQKFTGTKYVWGGNNLSKGVDCSGLTQQVYKQQGINIPRTAYEQSKNVAPVARENLQPGDLVFFDTVLNNGKSVDHVGIYAGNGQMVHASSSKGVTTTNMNSDYWKARYIKGGRP